MTTFTITTTQNIDELTDKTGGDVYNIDGGTLTVDQHSRFGLNNANTSATAATSMGNITLSATLGGVINFDSRYIRMIPFNGGSGTLPALNSLVTQGGASGKLMCVYSSLTAEPVVTGTIPASGWIMVKAWNSVEYAAGALTLSGITANATGACVQGFLEIFGDDTRTVTVNRLNQFNVLGAWYELGSTNGAAGQTFQIPNHGTLRHFAGVFIEATAGQGDYEFYPNGGTSTTTGTTVVTGTEAERGKIVWINNAGLVTIGNSGGTGLNGHVPTSGRKVVIPNIFFCCCTAAARNAEVIPSATLATRYDFTTTGAGVLSIDKANFCWYLSCTQPYSVSLSNSGFIDAVYLSKIASPLTISKCGVGNKPTTALAAAPLMLTLSFAGGTISDSVFQRVVTAGSSSSSVLLMDLDGFTFTNCRFNYNARRAHTQPSNIAATRVINTSFNNCLIIDGSINLVTCTNLTILNLKYIDALVSTTTLSQPLSAFNLSSNCLNVKIDGFLLPVPNNHPRTAILTIGPAGCTKIKFRNVGTRAAPLSLGSDNACGLILSLAGAAAARDVELKRVYCSNTESGIMTGDNSSNKIVLENVFGDYDDAFFASPCLEMVQKGLGTTKSLSAQTAVYGTHWMDYFTSTTAGRVAVVMNEPTADTSSQVTLANNAVFTSVGGLYIPTIGMSAVFEMPYFALGHTSFQNAALVMAGGTAGNYTYSYQINTGSGFGSWSSELTADALGTALNGLGALPATGFKLKLRITTSTTNATAITSVYILTNSTTEYQDYQYPLDTNKLTLTNIPTNAEVRIRQGSYTLAQQQDVTGGTFICDYVASGATARVQVTLPGYVFEDMEIALTAEDQTLPVVYSPDPSYIV
jgi:hypothetical protein